MSNQPKFNMSALSGGKSFTQIKVPQRPVDAEALFKGSRCSTPGKQQFVKIAFEAVYSKDGFKEVFACLKFPTPHGIAVEGTLITPEGVIRGPWEGATPPILNLGDDDRHAVCVAFAYADPEAGNLLVTTSKWWKPGGGEKPKLQHWANRPPMVFQEEEAAQEAAVILNFLGISAVLEEELDGFDAPKDPEGVYGVVMELMRKEREDYLAKRGKS